MSPKPGTLSQSGLPIPATDINALLQATQSLSLAAIERLMPNLLNPSGKSGFACPAQYYNPCSHRSFQSARLS